MNILEQINIITTIFILNILGGFMDNYSINYMFILSISIYLIIYILKRKIYIKNIYKKETLGVFVIIFYMVIITLLNSFSNIHLYNVIKLVLLLLPIFIGIMLIMIFGRNYIIEGLINISNIMTIINIFGIIEFINKENFFVNYMKSENARHVVNGFIHTQSYRTSTVFTNAIVYGTILVILFWINIYLIDNKKLKYFNISLILINIYGTRSRSSWIALLLSVVIFICFNFIKNNNKLKHKQVLAIISSLLFIMIIINTTQVQYIISEVISRFMELNTSTGAVSATQRLGTIPAIMKEIYNQFILQTFFGNGFGSVHNLMTNITIYIVGFTTTDNQYLSILWEFGIIGMIVIVYNTMKLIIINFKLNSKLSLCIIFSLISIAICMFFYEIFYWPIISQLLFVFIATLCIKDKCIY